MKRFDWLNENPITRELASQLIGTSRRRLPAATGLRRVLRAPEPLEPRLLLATFLVTNTNNSGAGSLRAAIADANAAAGPDVINFLIPGPGPHVISPQRTNPADPLSVAMPISSPMLIDGYSQTGASQNMQSEGNDANIRIRLDGALAGAGAGGLFIDGGGVTIQGLAITRFEDGVIIRGGSGGNTIAGNFIGLDPLGNPLGNLGHGVTIEGSPGNTIGGADPAARNVISANGGIGVRLVQSGSVDNVIRGNYIGTDPSGMFDQGNGGSLGPGGSGIEVGVFSIDAGYASRTIIGGTAPGAGNLISGNSGSGIVLLGTPSRDNVIQGNYIGTTAAGDAPLGNDRNGILLTLPLLQNGQPASGSASNNTIGGTEPGAGNVISGNKRHGISIFGPANNNLVQGNFIGADASGNERLGNGLDGIRLAHDADIINGPADNIIGGTLPGAGNVISGNDEDGIEIFGANTNGNMIKGNFIGTNADGTAAVPNSRIGVFIDGAANTTIGGTIADDRNVISGNDQAGVAMFGVGATGNKVQGNHIGTDVTGTSAIPNGNDGVRLGDNSLGAGPSGNLIGGTEPGAGNLISGNMDNGVEVAGATTTGNMILGNLIGTIVGGSGARPNQRMGILVEGAKNTIIGGTTPGARNVISGNGFAGIRLNLATATGNRIEGNYIGMTADAVAGLPNQGSGVLISNDASGNTVGGSTTSAGNVIAYNTDRGVVIESGTGNTVRLNSIHTNIGIGIDLNVDKETLNDQDDADVGANNTQNWPEIVRYALDDALPLPRATGFFDAAPNTTYQLDFYSNSGVSPTLLGEGQEYVSTETLTTDADGNVEFSFLIPLAFPLGKFLTVTATDPDGNTSEFSHDADNDGLYDPWELGAGIDSDNNGSADFFLSEPDPLHKDIYVEIDAMDHRQPLVDTIERVVTAFAAAPNSLLYNPDAQDGVSLHVLLDDWALPVQLVFANDFADFNVLKAVWFGTAAERSAPNAAVLLEAKRLAYRYCIFANEYSKRGSSGLGETPGNDFMVTLGGWPVPGGTADQQAGTFMHELGHTLGLHHGGDQDDDDGGNFKPNYYSIMNYLWQVPTADYSGWQLDYSRQKLPHLNENNLNEAAGIGGPAGVMVPFGPKNGPLDLADMGLATDWSGNDADGDNDFYNDVGVSTDINQDGSISLLTGFEDWSHLVYSFRGSPSFADGNIYVPDPDHVHLTFEMHQSVSERLQDGYTADFNKNGTVDAADYVVWRKTLGQNIAQYTGADGDGNGIVDQGDYGVWRANFGKTPQPPASGSGAGAAAALPQRQNFDELADTQTAEPATAVRASKSAERRENSYSAASPHFESPARNTTNTRSVSTRLMRADTSLSVRRQDDALLAWLATLATTDLSTDADALREVDTYRTDARPADIKPTTFDLAFQTLGF